MSERRYRVRKEIKRVKRRNALLAMVVAASLLLLFTVFAAEPMQKESKKAEPRYVEVTVLPGDTLWGIAQKYGNPKKDLRKTVWEIEQVNQIDDSTVYVGDTIFVPVR